MVLKALILIEYCHIYLLSMLAQWSIRNVLVLF